jgi:spermidine synthase
LVVDDGRRFLDGSTQTYDVIVIDPPPPPQSPGTSLLYSREFYSVIRQHLSKGGILEEWFFDDKSDPAIKASTAKSLEQSFPYVRAFPAVSGQGIYFLASNDPIPPTPASVLASRMPPSAVSDFVEWGPRKTASDQFDYVLSHELNVDQLIAQAPQVPALRDDAPINEYFLLRTWLHYYR